MRQSAQMPCALLLAAMLACETTGPQRRDPPPPRTVDLLIWSNRGHSGTSRPAVTANAVYFLGPDHRVTAVEKSTGRSLWSAVLPVEEAGQQGYGIAFAGGHVIVGDLDVFGLDPSTGAVKWRFQPTIGRRPGFRVLTTHDGVVYCGSASGHVYALDAATGTQRWATALTADPQTTVWNPVYRDGIVYVGFRRFPNTGPIVGGAAAIDAVTGGIIWTRAFEPRRAEDTGAGGMAITSSIAAVALLDGTIHGLDRATGAVKWTAPDLGPSADIRELAAAGEVVYAGSYTGLVLALSAVDGRQLWTGDVDRGSVVGVAADLTRVYVTHFGGQLAVFDAVTGKTLLLMLRQDFDPEDGFLYPPTVEGERMYLGGEAGVYAFKTI